MISSDDHHHRGELRTALQRDAARHARREADGRSFWRSMSILGTVGWPIAMAALGGVLVGRYLDERWHAGLRYTLSFLTAGVLGGCWIAWRTVAHRHD